MSVLKSIAVSTLRVKNSLYGLSKTLWLEVPPRAGVEGQGDFFHSFGNESN